jgi:hypothetical protein
MALRYMQSAAMQQNPPMAPSPTNPGWHLAGVGDSNRDGKPDLTWQWWDRDNASR